MSHRSNKRQALAKHLKTLKRTLSNHLWFFQGGRGPALFFSMVVGASGQLTAGEEFVLSSEFS